MKTIEEKVLTNVMEDMEKEVEVFEKVYDKDDDFYFVDAVQNRFFFYGMCYVFQYFIILEGWLEKGLQF